MLVVAEENGVNRTNLVCGKCRVRAALGAIDGLLDALHGKIHRIALDPPAPQL